ncbi:hypothetical protein [Paenimyroides aestuarii]|uniref:Uncharacterized protein n=1 Tax=Paenimyroides aestuarii TaxID=2968490 RepID=A0ABY5NRW8_9FLAO|nr:hypothetical protein [Paenimyroides aestuarii]UUV21273.1 hypothetical protein NPX36_13235 [Paenimyroides aestuarii]
MNYYIATKPLQYYNCLNIASNKTNNTIIIVNSFYNAIEFSRKVGKANFWDRSVFFNNLKEAYDFLSKSIKKNDLIFVDSDYGLQNFIFQLKVVIKGGVIFVYEEGIGSYRDNLYTLHKNLFARNIMKFFFRKFNHYGSSILCSGIYLYRINYHKEIFPNYRKKRFAFPNNLIENLIDYRYHLSEYSNIQIDNKINKIIIYLSSWKFNKSALKYISKSENTINIIKPHPHMLEIDEEFIENFDILLSPDILFELFIINLFDSKRKIIIYHEGSSSVENLEVLNLNFKKL